MSKRASLARLRKVVGRCAHLRLTFKPEERAKLDLGFRARASCAECGEPKVVVSTGDPTNRAAIVGG